MITVHARGIYTELCYKVHNCEAYLITIMSLWGERSSTGNRVLPEQSLYSSLAENVDLS